MFIAPNYTTKNFDKSPDNNITVTKNHNSDIGTGYGTGGGAAVNNSGNPTGSGGGFYNGGNITLLYKPQRFLHRR